MEKSEKALRAALSEFLSFLKFKVDNNILTLEEVASILRLIEEKVTVSGTAEDFAAFYHQSVTNVRSVIKRHIPDAHRRRVVYPFGLFRKNVPRRWHERACEAID